MVQVPGECPGYTIESHIPVLSCVMAGTKQTNYGSTNINCDSYFSFPVEMSVELKDITVSENNLNELRLAVVKLNTSTVLGQGSCGTVYEAKYSGTMCGAKRLDIQNPPHQEFAVSSNQRVAKKLKENFIRECIQHSKLHHPNIVRMIGVFYTEKSQPSLTQKESLPFLVMERMDCNLTQLLERSRHNIPMYVKLSILQDVSRGLYYLHDQNPPIVHQALYSDNILLTKGLTAKIGDFKTGAETVADRKKLTVRPIRNIDGFLPDFDKCETDLKYETSLNVFSFGCMICHVITEQWPNIQSPLPDKKEVGKFSGYDLKLKSMKDDWAVDKNQNYIDLISDYSLKKLVEDCLQRKSKNRPSMMLVDESMNRIITSEYKG